MRVYLFKIISNKLDESCERIKSKIAFINLIYIRFKCVIHEDF
jgi:hypothetical protein